MPFIELEDPELKRIVRSLKDRSALWHGCDTNGEAEQRSNQATGDQRRWRPHTPPPDQPSPDLSPIETGTRVAPNDQRNRSYTPLLERKPGGVELIGSTRRSRTWSGGGPWARGYSSLAIVLALALVWWLSREREDKTGAVVVTPVAKPFPSPRGGLDIDEAERVVEAFLGATDWQQLIPLVRDGARIAGQVKAYHNMHPLVPIRVLDFGEAEYLGGGSSAIWCLPFIDHTHRERRVHFSSKGQIRVLWEPFVAYGELSFREMAEGFSNRFDRSIMWLLTSNSDLYLPPFDDPERWLCVRLQHPSEEGSLFGYCERGTAAADKLAEMLATADRGHRLVLQISAEKHFGAQKVVVHDVLAGDWRSLSADGAPPGGSGPVGTPAIALSP